MVDLRSCIHMRTEVLQVISFTVNHCSMFRYFLRRTFDLKRFETFRFNKTNTSHRHVSKIVELRCHSSGLKLTNILGRVHLLETHLLSMITRQEAVTCFSNDARALTSPTGSRSTTTREVHIRGEGAMDVSRIFASTIGSWGPSGASGATAPHIHC